MASKLYRFNATIIIFVFVLYCIVLYCILDSIEPHMYLCLLRESSKDKNSVSVFEIYINNNKHKY